MTPSAIALARKRNVLCAPFRATQVGASLVNGLTFENQPLLAGETLDTRCDCLFSLLTLCNMLVELKIVSMKYTMK